MLLVQLAFVAGSFLLGSILFSYHIPLWLTHTDIVAESPDHNPGTANAFRLCGVPMGLLCLLFDFGKGFLPVWLGQRVLEPFFLLLPLVMAGPVLGHAATPWYPFHGGKAIATAFGVAAGLLPFSYAAWVLVFWYLFFSLVWVIHPNERRSVVTFLLFGLSCLVGSLFTGHYIAAIGCALMAGVPMYKNYIDIQRAESEMQRVPFDPATDKPGMGAEE